MKVFKLTFLFFMVFLCHGLFAQECTEAPTDVVEVSDNLGPIRDQDFVGFCYAYSGADLLEDYLKRHDHFDREESVSALALSLNHDKEDWKGRQEDFRALAAYRDRAEPQLQAVASSIQSFVDERSELFASYRRDARSYAKEHESYPGVERIEQDIEKLEGDDKERAQAKLVELKTAIINDLRESNEDFKNLYEKVQARNSELNEEIDSLRLVLNQQELLWLDLEIPAGGFAKDAIMVSWPRVCKEQEVSSRDTGVQNVYAQYKELYDGATIFSATSLKESLGFIYTYWNDESRQCSVYHLTQSLFPGFPFESYANFTDFLDGLASDAFLFDEMMERSCHSLAGVPEPKIEVVTGRNNKQRILDHIDEGLKNNRPVNVDYHSHILEQLEYLPQMRGDEHSSVIVGGFKLCGEEYYRLRNSWGTESCERDRHEILLSKVKEELEECVESEMNADVMIFCADDDEECLLREEKSSSDANNNCLKKLETEMPYYCENGEYVIKKSHFKQGVYNATYISN